MLRPRNPSLRKAALNRNAVALHTLVWHSQTPPWAAFGNDGQPVDRKTALVRMREHIDAVVGRYKGRVHAWEVVNEAIDDRGQLRSSPADGRRRFAPWYAPIGDDFCEKAFEYAHAADPDAELTITIKTSGIP